MRTVAVSGTLNTFHPERNHPAEENGIRKRPTKAFKEGGELGLSSSFTPTGAPSEHQLGHQILGGYSREGGVGSTNDVRVKSFTQGPRQSSCHRIYQLKKIKVGGRESLFTSLIRSKEQLDSQDAKRPKRSFIRRNSGDLEINLFLPSRIFCVCVQEGALKKRQKNDNIFCSFSSEHTKLQMLTSVEI